MGGWKVSFLGPWLENGSGAVVEQVSELVTERVSVWVGVCMACVYISGLENCTYGIVWEVGMHVGRIARGKRSTIISWCMFRAVVSFHRCR